MSSGPAEARASSVLDRHSRKFCVQLFRQVAHSSARIRVEQATPAFHRDLMTVALGWVFLACSPSSLSLQAPSQVHIWQLNSLYLFILEDKNYTTNPYQNRSDWPLRWVCGRSWEEMANNEVISGQKEDNCILSMVVKCQSWSPFFPTSACRQKMAMKMLLN